MGTLKTPVCKEGKEVLLAFNGSVWDYFWQHPRGFAAMRWLEKNCGYPQFEASEGFTHCGGNFDLRGYKQPLPEGLTHCGGNLYLKGYTHPLPEGFTHCGGNLYLKGYTHPLPEGFTHCGGDLILLGYTHPLPEGFTYCGLCWI